MVPPDYIEAFLRAAKDIGIRSFEEDSSYFLARFVQIVSNYIEVGGSTSIGIDCLRFLSCGEDNGTYLVKDWKIVDRIDSDTSLAETIFDEEQIKSIYQKVMEANKRKD